MKKLLFLVIASVAMYSCSNSQKQEEKANVDEFENIAKNVNPDPAHNAQNSLDVDGKYSGMLPTASGEGMDVIIILSGDKYEKTMTYIGKKKEPFTSKGTFSWNKEGNTITLSGEDVPNQYFVGENTLTQLDVEGKRITGELADNYVLAKEIK